MDCGFLLPVLPEAGWFILVWLFSALPFVISGWGFVFLGVAFGVSLVLENDRRKNPLVVFAPLHILIDGLIFVIVMIAVMVATWGLGSYLFMFLPFWFTTRMRNSARKWVHRT
jgi:hypothetical protein